VPFGEGLKQQGLVQPSIAQPAATIPWDQQAVMATATGEESGTVTPDCSVLGCT